MKILGIDYGDKKIGLAIADDKSRLAEPMQVIRYENLDKLIGDIKKVVKESDVGEIVIGVSEGESEEKARDFGENLADLGINIVFQDETLSTKLAQQKSIESGMTRKKRQRKEDSFAAAIILQSYFDNN